MPGERPDPQRPALVPDVAQLAVQLVDVDEHLGEASRSFIIGIRLWPPAMRLRLGAVPLQKLYGLLDRASHLILEPRRYLQRRLSFPQRPCVAVPTCQLRTRTRSITKRTKRYCLSVASAEAVSLARRRGSGRIARRGVRRSARSCRAMISPAMATAVSSGVRAPMSRPMGLLMRASCSSVTPSSFRRAVRLSWVLRLPIAPM